MVEVKEYNVASVYISGDKQSAYMTLIVDEECESIKEHVERALQETGVTYGIDHEEIEALCEKGESVSNVLIASGKGAMDGKDAEVIYHFDTERHVAPKQLENDNVDYKNMGYVLEVDEGTLLVEKTLPTEGIDGMNVVGEVVVGKDGKDANIRAGKNCRLSEDGLSIYAEVSGIIIFDNNVVTISDTLEVYEDIGVATGNISFRGNVNVHGSILAGMKVKCNKLQVDGMVEGAIIHAQGDVEVNKGIQGQQQAVIYSGGNLKSKYISNAEVYAKSNIEADLILNSKVVCDKDMILDGRKGCILGGNISVKGNVKAKTIGSDMGVVTKIVLGRMTALLEEIKELEADIAEKEESYLKIEQCLKVLELKLKRQPNNTNYREMMGKYTRNKFVTQSMINKGNEKLLRMHNDLTQSGVTTLECNRVHPGTLIVVGHDRMKIEELEKDFTIKSVRGQLITS